MPEPRLSVVVPIYNRAGTVGDCIASVCASAAAARLARGAIELILVDDGSSDGSLDVARAAAEAGGPEVAPVLIAQRNAGAAAARNAGAARARARFIAFLDSDDLWFDWTLAACLAALEEHPGAALLFLRPCPFSSGRPLRPIRRGGTFGVPHDGFIDGARAFRTRALGTNNVIVRRDVFRRLGGFAPEFRCLEDTDLFLRADREGPCVMLDGDDLMGRRRGEDDSLTDNWVWVLDGLTKMKARERAGGYPGGPGGDPRRVSFVAGAAVRVSRLCFANGRPGRAYAVFVGNLQLILAGGRGRWIWRLALTPLLAMLRPGSYKFRLRPAPR